MAYSCDHCADDCIEIDDEEDDDEQCPECGAYFDQEHEVDCSRGDDEDEDDEDVDDWQ
jgi:hypothetical protein